MAKRKRYLIATQHGYLADDFPTKAAAVRALAQELKAAARKCRQSQGTCSVIGSAKSGSAKILIGGRHGFNLWQRYVINEDKS